MGVVQRDAGVDAARADRHAGYSLQGAAGASPGAGALLDVQRGPSQYRLDQAGLSGDRLVANHFETLALAAAV